MRADKYMAKKEEMISSISGTIDDVSLGWLPRMPQYRIATLDTRTTYISRVDLTVEHCKGMARNSLNIASDEAQCMLHINYGAVVLKARVGFYRAVILAEDTGLAARSPGK